MAAMIAPADGGLGEEAYRGACLDHVGQVRLRVCGYQYHRDRRPVVAFLKCLSKIEATAWLALAFFPRLESPPQRTISASPGLGGPPATFFAADRFAALCLARLAPHRPQRRAALG